MRKTKNYKKQLDQFKVNIITLKRLISLLVEKTATAVILLKLKECSKKIKTYDDFHFLVEYVSKDVLNQEEVKTSLDKVYSIDDNKIVYDAEAAEHFSSLMFQLVNEDYIAKAFENYSHKNHKIEQMLERSKMAYNQATGETAEVCVRN